MLRNKQFPDTITLNLLSDGNDQIFYDNKKRVLTIFSGEINTLDGDHRISAILEYLTKNPEGTLNFELRITNFDEDTAKRFQEQVQTVNHFSKVQKEVLKIEKSSNKCVKRIMSGQSDFGNLIAENPSLIRVGNKLVSFITINSALQYTRERKHLLKIIQGFRSLSNLQWNEKCISFRSLVYVFDLNEQMLNREINQIADWVAEVIDEIIGLYPTDFIENRATSRNKSYITYENTFIEFIALARELRGRDDWQKLLHNTLSKINFSCENPIWTDLKITTQRSSLNKSHIKKICDYFISELGELHVL